MYENDSRRLRADQGSQQFVFSSLKFKADERRRPVRRFRCFSDTLAYEKRFCLEARVSCATAESVNENDFEVSKRDGHLCHRRCVGIILGNES